MDNNLNQEITLKEQWICAIPLHGIVLSKAIKEEFVIDRVTLVSHKKINSSRNRFYGISKSQYFQHSVISSDKTKATTFALIKFCGEPNTDQLKLERIVNEEINVLLSSHLGKRIGSIFSFNTLKSSTNYIRANLYVKDDKYSSKMNIQNVSDPSAIVIDSKWKEDNNKRFLLKLLKVVCNKSTDRRWKSTIRSVLILIGQSHNSNNLSFCFLWNMIAIETLLTDDNERNYRDLLKERMEAFFGWLVQWRDEEYLNKINDLYNLRCDVVHQGKLNKVSIEHLLFSDELLLNLLINIAHYPKIFSSKKILINYCDKFQAEKVLGIKSKVQPKNLRYLRRKYSDKNMKELRSFFSL